MMVVMNKAFVREPDDAGDRKCPRCGSLGQMVGRETVARHVVEGAQTKVADPAFFCPHARCEVVYFDEYERVIEASEANGPIWPKDPTAPLCSCFGLDRDDIEADIAEGGVTRVKEVVTKAKSNEANCRVLAPNGHSCVAEVQRYFMRRRAELADHS